MMEFAQIFTSSMERAPWGWALAAMVALALIRIWPELSKQRIEERAQARAADRERHAACEQRIELLSKRMDEIYARSHDFEMKLVGTIAAYKILDSATDTALGHVGSEECEAVDAVVSTLHPALMQARNVMSTTFELSPSTDSGPPRTQPAFYHFNRRD